MANSQSVRPAATGSRALTGGFFTDTDFDFETRLALGATAYGVGDPGSVLATVVGIADGDWRGWFSAWMHRGDQFAALGVASAADPPGAMWAHLSASAAYSRALAAVDGLPAGEAADLMLATFRSSRRS